jgi:hypothetical protein
MPRGYLIFRDMTAVRSQFVTELSAGGDRPRRMLTAWLAPLF